MPRSCLLRSLSLRTGTGGRPWTRSVCPRHEWRSKSCPRRCHPGRTLTWVLVDAVSRAVLVDVSADIFVVFVFVVLVAGLIFVVLNVVAALIVVLVVWHFPVKNLIQ